MTRAAAIAGLTAVVFLAGVLAASFLTAPAIFLATCIVAIVIAGSFYLRSYRSKSSAPSIGMGSELIKQDASLLAMLGKNEGIYERDLATNQFYHTEGFLRSLDYEESHPIRMGANREELNNLIHPDDRDPNLIDDYIAAVSAAPPDERHGLGVLVQDFRMLDGNGKYRWVRARSTLRFNEAGKPVALAGIVYDNHDFKLLELEQPSFLRAVVELFGVWDLQSDQLVQVSTQWQVVLGYSEEELRGRSLDELVHPDDVNFLRRLSDEMQAKPESHGDYRQASIKFKLSNNNYQVFSCRFMHSPADDNRILVVLFDSESVALQTLSSVANTLPNGYYLFDVKEQNVIFYNQQLPRMLGYTPAEYDSQRNVVRLQVIHPDDVEKVTAQLQEIVENNTDEIYSLHYRIKTKNGSPRTLLRHGVVYQRDRNNNPIQLSLTVTDITELVAQSVELERVNARLEVSNTDLERFGYVASHDLQEPLRAISGYLQLLDEKLEGQLDSTSKRYIDASVAGAARMRQLINDLLSFSRLQKKGFTFTPVELPNVLRRACEDLSVVIEQEQAKITSDNLPTISGVEALLTELFSNMIGNAIKYRHPERLPEIKITSREHGEYIVLQFKDNGIGIPEAHQEQIFELFARLHRREEYPGTGIGLAICKRIVNLHEGKIELRSTPGQGSAFEVYLHSRLQPLLDSPDVSAVVGVE